MLHLGNGASACAVRDGRSVDTSMGMTPLEGLVMGTRSGDIDPAAIFHLHRQAGMGFDEHRADAEPVERPEGAHGQGRHARRAGCRRRGDEVAEEALAVYRHRLRHYIGAYVAELGGLDALVFTAGVGENNSLLRRRTLDPLRHLGLHVDPRPQRGRLEAAAAHLHRRLARRGAGGADERGARDRPPDRRGDLSGALQQALEAPRGLLEVLQPAQVLGRPARVPGQLPASACSSVRGAWPVSVSTSSVVAARSPLPIAV